MSVALQSPSARQPKIFLRLKKKKRSFIGAAMPPLRTTFNMNGAESQIPGVSRRSQPLDLGKGSRSLPGFLVGQWAGRWSPLLKCRLGPCHLWVLVPCAYWDRREGGLFGNQREASYHWVKPVPPDCVVLHLSIAYLSHLPKRAAAAPSLVSLKPSATHSVPSSIELSRAHLDVPLFSCFLH